MHAILVRSDNPGVKRYAESLKQVPQILGHSGQAHAADG